MHRSEFHEGRQNKLYWSQFSHGTTGQDPSIDYVRFIILLLISVLILTSTDDPILRQLFMITGIGSGIMITLILLFAKKRY